MFNNYYFLKQLSQSLKEPLTDLEFAACFSQSKDELIMGFCNPEREFWVRAALLPNFNILAFPIDYQRSKRNSVDIFKDALGKKVTGITQYLNERIFSVDMEEGYQLVFKMFGNRSNIILVKDYLAIELFQSRHSEDLKINTLILDREIEQSFEAFEKADKLMQIYPTLGKEVNNLLKEKGYHELESKKEQWDLLQETIQLIDTPEHYYITDDNGKIELLLFDTPHTIKKVSNPLKAANEFYYTYSKDYFINQEKLPLLKELKKKASKTESYIFKSLEKIDELEKTARHDEIANIIMANLHQIPPRTKKITLYDFYHDQDISLKLNETLTPQKNAENYYRKAKNQKIEIGMLRKNIEQKEEELEKTQKYIEEIEPIEQVKALRKYMKANGLENIQAVQDTFPFRRFEFMNYEIWVGKNAVNNDLLTQKHAHKNDIWLHARDVTGSHVVIKHQAGKNIPVPVLEKAASLAAYYSVRKTDTLCPVIYTPKKFVRKRKGDPAGAVVVDKEQVILIEPSGF